MNKQQWNVFCSFRQEFKDKVEQWKAAAPELSELQKEAVEKAKAPLYHFETTVVYNKALDELKEEDNIKLIVIGDNPGKDEQLIKNNKYLVGQAGKIAEGYFRKNPQLGIDFRKDVIILNKTPIHSGKTNQLKTIAKSGGEKIASLIKESQLWMAERTAQLHCDLCKAAGEPSESAYLPELWLVGYAELKNKGIFTSYRDRLKEIYEERDEKSLENVWEKVFVFQHFSMNRFTIDLNDFIKREKWEELPLMDNIHKVGVLHRKEIFQK